MVSFEILNIFPSLPKQDVFTEIVRRINDKNLTPSRNK